MEQIQSISASSSDTSNPTISIHIIRPGFNLPSPEDVERSIQQRIYAAGGVVIARLSSGIVVKYGPLVTLIEATTTDFVARNSTAPVPSIYASYTYGPLNHRQSDDILHDTYIFMDYIDGVPLDQIWNSYDQITKSNICVQLQTYLESLRAIPAAGYVGSLEHNPVADMILGGHWNKGPFKSEVEFNAAIAEAFARIQKGEIARFINGMLNAIPHRICLAHGDLRRANIMVKDGVIVAIIDWELAGWYPEYWDFVKIFYVYHFQDDWGDHVLRVLQPFFAEAAIHSYLVQYLW